MWHNTQDCLTKKVENYCRFNELQQKSKKIIFSIFNLYEKRDFLIKMH